jgi:hypothetical protein
MGISQHVAIGPYAEFRVPEGRSGQFLPEGEDGFLCWQTLACNSGLEVRRDCYRYVPRWNDVIQPPREMYFMDKPAACIPDQD